MPNYVSDLIDEEEKKKDKSIVDRLKSRFNKDYSKELPHGNEGLEDKPWEKVTPTPSPSPKATPKAEPKPKTFDEEIKDLPIDEAERLRRRNKKISERVGGWSRK